MFKYTTLLWLAAIAFFTVSCGDGTKTQNTNNSADSTDSTDQKAEIGDYSIEDFYESTSIRGGSFSPNGQKLLYSSNETGIYNLYEIDLATGQHQQLTHSTKETMEPIGYLPDNESVVYAADKGGNEMKHLYLLQNGESTDLTPGEKVKAGFSGWNDDHSAFYYSSTKRDPKYFDIYKMDVNNQKSELLYQHDGEWDYRGLSHNEQYLALGKTITTSNTELVVKNLETGDIIQVSDPAKPGSYSAAGFSHNDEWMYYLSDADGEFKKVLKLNLATGEKEEEFATNWDVSYYYETNSGAYKIAMINNDGRNEIKAVDTKTGDEMTLPDIEDAEILSVGFNKDENLMRLTVGSSKSPSNLYTYNLTNQKLSKHTNTLNPAIKAEDLVAAQVVRFKSFDGMEIPAIYYKPQQASPENKVPAMLYIHGGPGGQSRTNFTPLIQYMVNQGYAVLAVNNRGSSGYGKTFFNADNQNHGDKDLKDCIWGKKWLQKQDYIDGDKIGILGGSYGGYMTMAAMAFEPKEFAVGVNLFGVTNWLRTLKSIPPFWESFRDALYNEMGDPTTKDSVRLYNISPLFHADKIENPVMVLQGANDPRVLQVESDEMVEAVKANDVPVEYVLFEDEGHGFRKKENEIEAYGKIVAFLDEYLKGEQ